MFRMRTDEDHETDSASGVRHLFRLGSYEFQDVMDAEDRLHHYIRESMHDGATLAYEVDHPTMYEFMARYLAGTYELEEYRLEQSPSHLALLDVLEIATARARAGESGFSWEEFDRVENELMDDADPDETSG